MFSPEISASCCLCRVKRRINSGTYVFTELTYSRPGCLPKIRKMVMGNFIDYSSLKGYLARLVGYAPNSDAMSLSQFRDFI